MTVPKDYNFVSLPFLRTMFPHLLTHQHLAIIIITWQLTAIFMTCIVYIFSCLKAMLAA
jgi:hypothetical protein